MAAHATKCSQCGNFLLPWVLYQYQGWAFLARPCPLSGCGFAILDKLFKMDDDENEGYWYGQL